MDRNIRRHTGKGTFHGMGIIAITFPKLKYNAECPEKDCSNRKVSKLSIYLGIT